LERWKQAKFDDHRDNRQERVILADLREDYKSEIRVLLTCRTKRAKYLREASKAVDDILIGLLTLTTGAASV
jgi:hypothetical protein